MNEKLSYLMIDSAKKIIFTIIFKNKVKFDHERSYA